MRSGKKFFSHHCQECLVFTLQKYEKEVRDQG